VDILDEAPAGPVTPVTFSTTAVTEIRDVLHRTPCPLIDFFDLHMERVESILGSVPTIAEAEGVIAMLAAHGLRRGENDLQVIIMCELPNAVIAHAFLDHFDGFSIGSDDMTQLTLGLGRDSALVAAGFDESDAAVKFMISTAIKACKARGKTSASAAKAPATTQISPNGCSGRASTLCHSTRTPSSRPGFASASSPAPPNWPSADRPQRPTSWPARYLGSR
jgi:hypothetical protein